MSDEIRILVMGHSHAGAYSRVFRQREKAGETYGLDATFARFSTASFQPNFEFVAGKRRIHPDLKRRIRHMIASRDPDVVLCALMGNEYNRISILSHPEPYDFDLPDSGLPMIEGATVIPYALMRAQIEYEAENNALLFWREINAASDKPVLLVPPPPPIADEDHIRQFPGNFADRLKKYKVSPVEFRIKVWMLYCSVLRDATAQTASRFVELPDRIFDNGSLAKQYWSTDPTHGNDIFGAVMLDHVTELARHQKSMAESQLSEAAR